MNPRDHTELLSVEMGFPKRGQNGIPVTIWLHMSVVRFFKRLTEEQIQDIQKYLGERGEQYFAGRSARSWCRFQADKEYGLRGWDCPGNATGFDMRSSYHRYARDETSQWIPYDTHNVDNSEQFAYLLAVACYFRDLAEASLRAK